MFSRACTRALAAQTGRVAAQLVKEAPKFAQRRFASTHAQNLVKCLNAEITHEKSQYEKPAIVKKFLEKNGWAIEEKEGDVNVGLTKKVNDMKVTVDFQLTSPVQPEEDGEDAPPQDLTDFSVTIENAENAGMTLYCSTCSGQETHRFMIGNVRSFTSAAEKENPAGYNGPEFEDLDENMQEALDEWLSSVGVNEELCDFIDAAGIDKEQREYMRWLNSMSKFLQSA